MKDLLVYIAKRSGIQKPNIILPSYIPAKLYRTSLAGGFDVKFYEVYGKCTFELAEVERLIDANTRVIFYVHYFGFPNQIEEMAALAKKKGIALIEDCALTIGGTYRGKKLGNFGDFALFSMRKMFMFSEGGFLRLNDEYGDYQPNYEWRVKNCFSVQKYVKQRAKYLYMKLTGGADLLRLVRPDPLGYMDWSTPTQTLNVKMMSSFSVFRLNFADVSETVELRRRNYQYVSERFPSSANLQPVNPILPDGCSPYSFPFLVLNGKRDMIREKLLKNGTVSGAGWPEAPFIEGLPKTRILAGQLLEIPIHQALTQQQIDRSLRVIEKFK